MDSFFDIPYKALPEPVNRFDVQNIGEKVYYGSFRVVFDNGGGFMQFGQVGYDVNGRMRYGQILNDGDTERIFLGIER